MSNEFSRMKNSGSVYMMAQLPILCCVSLGVNIRSVAEVKKLGAGQYQD
jgi:hypothetical protein